MLSFVNRLALISASLILTRFEALLNKSFPLNDIIRLYGVFDGPIKLDSWNVSINSVGWTSFGINESGGLSWNFNFPEGTGYYYFYSIAKRENWDDESPPSSYDSICYYNP